MVEAVRLVIWDLDETFWRGTLTEGGHIYQQHIHDIVVTLAARGIVSTICSKNDQAPVQAILEAAGIWDYFVMPSINWEPKGQRIAQLVENFQLRAPTILFIDDNAMNLQEAAHYVPGLQIADETIIPSLLDDPRFAGKDDRALTRLAQYRLLAQRQAGQTAAGGDNIAFLRQSGIRVEIDYDVMAHADRAIELINRTNQLNFTKSRLPDDPAEAHAALATMVSNFDTQCGLIRVRDNYGDYGLCGFYLIRNTHAGKRLRHFCFSCRILNMGVEAWVYSHLNRPELRVVGEVIGSVEGGEAIDWISFGAANTPSAAGLAGEGIGPVFVHGGCDLAAVSHYFGMVSKTVFGRCNTVRGGVDVRLDHSQFLALAATGLGDAQAAAARLLGYTPEDFPPTLIEEAAASRVWLLSFWADTHFALYRHDASGLELPFTLPVARPGGGHADLTRIDPALLDERPVQPWLAEAFGHLQRSFTFAGISTQALFQRNLRRLLAFAPHDTPVFILGANEQEMAGARRVGAKVLAHRALNVWTAEVCAERPGTHLVNIRDFVRDESEVHQLNHFDRMVYYRIYEHVLAEVARGARAGAGTSEWVAAA